MDRRRFFSSASAAFALLRPDSAADERAEWRHFLSTDGGVAELRCTPVFMYASLS